MKKKRLPQVKPTAFDGVSYRSRLEARWAVFFRLIGVSYRYEVEKFALKAGVYIPDFHLPDLGLWVEIKPDEPSAQELAKVCELAELKANERVVLLCDVPAPKNVTAFWPDPAYGSCLRLEKMEFGYSAVGDLYVRGLASLLRPEHDPQAVGLRGFNVARPGVHCSDVKFGHDASLLSLASRVAVPYRFEGQKDTDDSLRELCDENRELRMRVSGLESRVSDLQRTMLSMGKKWVPEERRQEWADDFTQVLWQLRSY